LEARLDYKTSDFYIESLLKQGSRKKGSEEGNSALGRPSKTWRRQSPIQMDWRLPQNVPKADVQVRGCLWMAASEGSVQIISPAQLIDQEHNKFKSTIDR
jgi:hypothetical protein